MALCLVVEDDEGQRAILVKVLSKEGYEVVSSGDGAGARELCRIHRPEIILLDLGLPDVDGLELISAFRHDSPLSRLVILSGRNSVSVAVEALRAGARHYLVKPWEQDELLTVVEREVRAVDLAEVETRLRQSEIYWGTHPGMLQLRAQLQRLADSPLTPVLIEGETGVGKEVVARELHRFGKTGGAFVPMNCAAVPSELMESELFGHERGAFTGADARRRGLAELSRSGVLFLDEIGEMALPLQAKLLRFLQDGRFRRVGGEEELESRCRVIAATHKNLQALENEGEFRSDLYYRIAIVRLVVPPLRERRADLLPLAYTLLRSIAGAIGRAEKQLSPEAERAVAEHSWPGNVRELKIRLERALVLAEGEQLESRDLDLVLRRSGTLGGTEGETADTESSDLRRLLREEDWNVAGAARRLGVPRHWIRYRMTKYGICSPREKKTRNLR